MADIVLNTAVLDGMISRMNDKAEKILSISAGEIEAETKNQIRAMDVIDTGNLHNSIHVVDEHPPLTRLISDATDYGLYQHEGFHFRNGRYFPGRPFMSLAVQIIRPRFYKAMEALFR